MQYSYHLLYSVRTLKGPIIKLQEWVLGEEGNMNEWYTFLPLNQTVKDTEWERYDSDVRTFSKGDKYFKLSKIVMPTNESTICR